MKRKLIELNQSNLIVCDNPDCDFVVVNETGDANINSVEYVNKPCPKCGQNLLTERDYEDYMKFIKYVNFINKWFSWITIFYSKNPNYVDANVKIHNEKININLK